MAGVGVCVEVLLRGKRHEDLPSGSEIGEQGDGVFRGGFSEEKKNAACWEAKGRQASAVEETETHEYERSVFKINDQKQTSFHINIQNIKHYFIYDSAQELNESKLCFFVFVFLFAYS